MRFNEKGQELPDNTPVEMPAGHKRPESIQDMIRRLVRTDVSAAAERAGAESFEEANDFEVEEDDAELFPTHHELHEEVVDETLRVKREAAARRANRAETGDEAEDDGEAAEAPPRPARSRKKKAPRRVRDDDPEEELYSD